ncbi:hypothetical protein [Streptomyces sp. NBC_01803]|uniref:hypothetical protein n=1 Tax=Streptomyces sp. NBC_01803 TaxID=2975946 RepID=UPI002DDB2F12|nr:hypothetical protein [Streptomyces sp. NBC_01803]WSA46471.1 hypothetical protein OIE51_21175 [Streptomyces sp. NBC_01803]
MVHGGPQWGVVEDLVVEELAIADACGGEAVVVAFELPSARCGDRVEVEGESGLSDLQGEMPVNGCRWDGFPGSTAPLVAGRV